MRLLSRYWLAAFLVCVSLLVPRPVLAAEQEMPDDQKREFLLTAKVIKSKQLSKGVTAPWKLTLTDGQFTHDAVFQSIEESKANIQFAGGRSEINFRDSFHFNIAAYELARVLGLDKMMPVTVERKWQGKTGSLAWWINWKWDEGMRIREKLTPPDPEGWNQQMHRMRVFAQLVYDTDRNLGNVLITEDWKLYMIDFTRAFRLYNDLENSKNLDRCDRELFDRIKKLSEEQVTQAAGRHLRKPEVRGIMARRDKIIAAFEKAARERGESAIFY